MSHTSIIPNILYLGGFELPDKNAAAQRVMSNAKLLRELGFEVTLVGVAKDKDGLNGYYDGFNCISIPYPQKINEWLKQILTFISKEEIKSYSPKYVVLYNFPAIASLRILHFCHKNGIKVVHDLTEWEQTDGFSPRNMIKRIDTQLRMHYCMKKMDGVIAISKYLYNYYKDLTTTILIPPTIDLTDPKWCRGRDLMANKPITLVYAGSPGVKSKDRLDYIINAVAKYPHFRLNIVGITQEQYEGSYGPIDSSIKNTQFMGRLSHKDALKAICSADFQMLIRENTLKNTAGFPTKFVESISCCTPLIATLTSNIGDYLEDGVNGFVVDKTNTIEDVLGKISNMSADSLILMKQKCRDFKKFDFHYYKNDFEKLFK